MLGPEGAGKTSTVHSLVGKEFQPEQPSTVGAALNSCTIDRIIVNDHLQEERQKINTLVHKKLSVPGKETMIANGSVI